MKKSLIILGMAAFIFACNDSAKDTSKDSADTTKTETASNDTGPKLPDGITKEDYDKGLNLIAQSDCLTCHDINKKITGPTYAEVAARYPPTKENITLLAGKIIKGGSGVWGETPMTPHPDMPQEEAEAMVKYVLSLKQ